MIFFKLKRNFVSKSKTDIVSHPRIVYNLNAKKKLTLYDLRKLYYSYIYVNQLNGSLILQNRGHSLQNVYSF